MQSLEQIIEKFSTNEDLQIEEIPNLDLYMDQILTFFSDHFAKSSENTKSELLTKSMINNYTKEKILSPVKGKKYNRTQIIQLLCIMNLKQTLSLSEIKKLINSEDMSEEQLESAYSASLQMKNQLIPSISKDIAQIFAKQKKPFQEEQENVLEMVLALSSLSNFLNQIASNMVTNLHEK